ncbi:MAG: response regulator transcription factor [Bacteroidales bacterium]|nr:response regulator transcription factor [Bacteroidales bacterium]
MKNVKILIADEDQTTAALRSHLVSKGYDIVWAKNGQAAIDAFSTQLFDFCILEMSLPNKDGLAVLKELRAINKNIPILFLTSRSSEKDHITAFKAGCDDFVQKPYSMEELVLRIKAILKRVHSSTRRQTKQINVYNIGIIKFNVIRQTLSLDNKVVYRLTTKETSLLSLLCEYKNRLLERNEALVRIWGDEGYFNARSMDVYITKIRRFLTMDPNVRILNVHGIGFKLVTDNETEQKES